MKILFCVEFYYPSVGGAQEVVRQIAERMQSFGHTVSVATTRIGTRGSANHNGVRIIEFSVSGNRAYGLSGEVDRYQNFLTDSDFDVVMFYAAQQWTFDAAWPVMPKIKARKVFVPCGYSCLFEAAYRSYFEELPAVLKQVDSLIYHAEEYRDVRFGKSLGLGSGTLIPNGADTMEFSVPKDPAFRQSILVDPEEFVILTVGTMTGLKGHLELLKSFAVADFGDRKATLILNGNSLDRGQQHLSRSRLFLNLLRQFGLMHTSCRIAKSFLRRQRPLGDPARSIRGWADKINKEQGGRKKVIIVDLPRESLVQAYLNADLFVFASNIEYSPLVLFEACAAGLPFLSVPVGNAAEIAAWTEGGLLCHAPVDSRGYTRAAPTALAHRMEEMASDHQGLRRLSRSGQEATRRRYNWDYISREYEHLFRRLSTGTPDRSRKTNLGH